MDWLLGNIGAICIKYIQQYSKCRERLYNRSKI